MTQTDEKPQQRPPEEASDGTDEEAVREAGDPASSNEAEASETEPSQDEHEGSSPAVADPTETPSAAGPGDEAQKSAADVSESAESEDSPDPSGGSDPDDPTSSGSTDPANTSEETGLDLSKSSLDAGGRPPKGPTGLAKPAPPGEPPGSEPEELDRMTLMGHLEELRNRIVKSLVVGFLGFLVCWVFAKDIYRFLARPVMAVLPEGKKLVFLTVTEPFFLYMKVAALAALFLTSPYILWQVWRFIAPGLYRHERRYSLPFIFFGSTFFLAGGVFAYYVAFPFAIEFLVGVGIEDFEPAITGRSYFSFLLTVILGLGAMFELPVFIFVLSQLGLVTPQFLLKNFRWAVLLIFIAAAIITPTPDVINLTIFAVPTILLYLVGVAAAWVVQRKKK